jgi:phage terminase large subunit-like protein
MNDIYLRYLEVAKSITGSSDIDVLIEAANKIASAANNDIDTWEKINNYVETGYSFGSLPEFLEGFVNPTNKIPFRLYPFQEALAKTLSETKQQRVFIMAARQMGITHLLSGYALHEALEKDNQTILICANTFAMAVELLSRIYYMIDNTKFCAPGIKVKNKLNLELDNGSRIIARTFSDTSVRGMSLTHAIVDQAAYVSYSKEHEFYDYLLTALSRGKLVLASTPPRDLKGRFYEMWIDPTLTAERMVVPWFAHPHRDQHWADVQKMNLGEAAFAREYDCSVIEED